MASNRSRSKANGRSSVTPPLPASPMRSRRALADEVSDHIAREFIFSGLIEPGELLPSEKELAERYGVSRVTTRASLRTLREAGLISVRQGVGSIVQPRTEVMRYGLDRLSSMETFAREAGHELETVDLEIDESVADEEMAAALQIAEGDPVFVVARTKRYQGSRVAWLVDTLRQDIVPLATIRDELRGSVLDVLLAHDELAVDYADCEIEPVAMPDDVAARLEVAPGTLGLRLDEVVYAMDGRPLVRCRGWHLRDYRRFFVRRRRVGS